MLSVSLYCQCWRYMVVENQKKIENTLNAFRLALKTRKRLVIELN